MPLVARASVTHGFGVVVTGNHLNRTATSGYVARLVVTLISFSVLSSLASHVVSQHYVQSQPNQSGSRAKIKHKVKNYPYSSVVIHFDVV